MRWSGYALVASVVLVFLASNIYYQSSHHDLPVLKSLHRVELLVAERSRTAARVELANCTVALAEQKQLTDVITDAALEAESLKAELRKIKAELIDMRQREKVSGPHGSFVRVLIVCLTDGVARNGPVQGRGVAWTIQATHADPRPEACGQSHGLAVAIDLSSTRKKVKSDGSHPSRHEGVLCKRRC